MEKKKPENAGTKYTPSVFSTCSASEDISLESFINPRLSRNHLNITLISQGKDKMFLSMGLCVYVCV